jgi:hypothetical protein
MQASSAGIRSSLLNKISKGDEDIVSVRFP